MQLESGEYFMSQEQRDARKEEAQVASKEEKALAKKAKREAAFVPPQVVPYTAASRHSSSPWVFNSPQSL